MRKIKLTHLLLAASLIGFAIAAIDQQPTIFAYVSLPVATVLMGLFLIVTMLEKESALYEEQARQAGALWKDTHPVSEKKVGDARGAKPSGIEVLSPKSVG
jgi:hypothetical protein